MIPADLSPAEIDAWVRERAARDLPLYELDRAALAAAAPDLILTQDLCRVCALPAATVAEACRVIGTDAEVLTLDPHSLDDVLDAVRPSGRPRPPRTAAGALTGRLRARMAAVERAVAGRPRPRVLVLEWTDPPYLAGHWVPELVRRAGGQPVGAFPASAASPRRGPTCPRPTSSSSRRAATTSTALWPSARPLRRGCPACRSSRSTRRATSCRPDPPSSTGSRRWPGRCTPTPSRRLPQVGSRDGAAARQACVRCLPAETVGHDEHPVAAVRDHAGQELHFGRAARRHYIVPQAFGREVQRLERELGVRLFDRTSRRVALTTAGERFVVRARQVLAQVDELGRIAAEDPAQNTGVLRVGVLGFGLADRWPRMCELLAAQHPRQQLTYVDVDWDSQYDAVRSGEVDVSVAHDVGPTDGLTFDPVLDVGRFAVVPRRSPLADAEWLTESDVSGEQWVRPMGRHPVSPNGRARPGTRAARARWSAPPR